MVKPFLEWLALRENADIHMIISDLENKVVGWKKQLNNAFYHGEFIRQVEDMVQEIIREADAVIATRGNPRSIAGLTRRIERQLDELSGYSEDYRDWLDRFRIDTTLRDALHELASQQKGISGNSKEWALRRYANVRGSLTGK